MKNIIFVGGAGRSETTYLAHALSKFDLISTGVESQWLSELLKLDLPNTEWVHFVQNHWKVDTSPRKVSSAQWEELSKIASDKNISLFCSKLLSFLAKDDLPFIVDHTPTNIVNYQLLVEHFPKAKFLHIIRDGRAVFASLKNVKWGANTPFAAANYWARFLAHGFVAKSLNMNNNYREVQYEKLLRDSDEIRSIVSWVSENSKVDSVDDELLSKNDVVTEIPKHTKSQHSLVNKGPQVSRINAWENDLSIKEVKSFENQVGYLLQFYGYDLKVQKNAYINRSYRVLMEFKEVLFSMLINPILNAFRTKGKHL